MSSSRFECHITAKEDNSKAATLLSESSGLSKQRIKRAMLKGAVWITNGRGTHRLRRADTKVREGDELHLYYDESVLTREVPTPRLIADEGGYSVWFKPYGMLSQGSKWGDHCTINRWAEQHLTPQRPAFVVHRLDRAATGLIIIAHRKKTAAALTDLFKNRKVEKRYKVEVEGRFNEQQTPLHIDTDIDGRAASSSVRFIAYDPVKNRSRLEVQIETGRKHQIRRHLAGIGFPVVGDRLYGDIGEADKKGGGLDLRLTAYYLSFRCPQSGKIKEYTLAEA